MTGAIDGLQRVDMRSDTVTTATPEMLAAMVSAEVGDDVFGEDPTVIKLQKRAAELCGKEAALYVPTGTMANLASLLSHCDRRGAEIIVGNMSHIHIWEAGGSATLGGIHSRAMQTKDDGTLDLAEIEAAIRPFNDHFPVTRLVAIEQTHNMTGGKVLPLQYIGDLAALCRKHGLLLHMDGARLGNACASLNVSFARMLQDVDSASICFSKGLASPIGSVIVGSRDFITKCRRWRKALGGGMRQAGHMAACGLLSLEHMTGARLLEDHKRAKALGEALDLIPGVRVEPAQSNMVLLELAGVDATVVVERLKARGTLVLSPRPRFIRCVVHYQIDDAGIDKAIADFKAVIGEVAQSGEPAAKRQKA